MMKFEPSVSEISLVWFENSNLNTLLFLFNVTKKYFLLRKKKKKKHVAAAVKFPFKKNGETR